MLATSMPLRERRSARSREPRRFLADEQALRRQQEQERQEIARVIREAVETVEPSDSSEHELADHEGSSSDDDSKASPATENFAPWLPRAHDISEAAYSDAPIVQLPRHRVATELGFL